MEGVFLGYAFTESFPKGLDLLFLSDDFLCGMGSERGGGYDAGRRKRTWQDGECAGHELFRTNEGRSRKVDVVFTLVNRKFADDILRRAVTAEPDRAQAKQQ